MCKEHFKHTNFASFNRQVNGWGFKRFFGQGPDHLSYYHELCLRGRPELASVMRRLVHPGKRLPNKATEPNLYEISLHYPLPEVNTVVAGASAAVVARLEERTFQPVNEQPPPPPVAASASLPAEPLPPNEDNSVSTRALAPPIILPIFSPVRNARHRTSSTSTSFQTSSSTSATHSNPYWQPQQPHGTHHVYATSTSQDSMYNPSTGYALPQTKTNQHQSEIFPNSKSYQPSQNQGRQYNNTYVGSASNAYASNQQHYNNAYNREPQRFNHEDAAAMPSAEAGDWGRITVTNSSQGRSEHDESGSSMRIPGRDSLFNNDNDNVSESDEFFSDLFKHGGDHTGRGRLD